MTTLRISHSSRLSWLMLIIGLYAVSISHQAMATTSIPSFISQQLDSAKTLGQSRFTYYFFDIYDATLYAPNGEYSPQQPFALSLAYLRDFKGRDIADRSIDEMRDLGYRDVAYLAQWLVAMESAFPDIKSGDVLTGLVDPQQHTQFYLNGEPTHYVADPQFTEAFFAIWLSDNTSQPKMRKQLLGQSK